jgi:hypothetical protein
MLFGKTYIFIHVEGDYVPEGDVAGLVHSDQPLIYAQRGRSGRKTQYKGSCFLVIVDGVSDMLGSPLAHLVVIVFDNQFHCFTLRF